MGGKGLNVLWLCVWLFINNLFICVQYLRVYMDISLACHCCCVLGKLHGEGVGSPNGGYLALEKMPKSREFSWWLGRKNCMQEWGEKAEKKLTCQKAATLPLVSQGVAHLKAELFLFNICIVLMLWIKRPQKQSFVSCSKQWQALYFHSIFSFSICCITSLELFLEQEEVVFNVCFL